MSAEYLGETFDIHGGGIDLVFPHHENEVAQSECAHRGAPVARYWMHNGHLNVEGAKMSKSLGNFVTIHELLHEQEFGDRKWPGAVLRLAMLMTHYRQPIDWTVKRLEDAERALRRMLYTVHQGVILNLPSDMTMPQPSSGLIDALLDDLNTPLAVGFHLNELMKAANPMGTFDFTLSAQLWADLLFLGVDPIQYFREQPNTFMEIDFKKEEIDALVDKRNEARRAKDFAEADRIRDELDAKGIVLKDGLDGTTWEVKR
jgi:cysteinyl-tRNA synthetase